MNSAFIRIRRASALGAVACVVMLGLAVAGCGSSGSSAADGGSSGPTLTTTLPPAKGEVDKLTWGLPYGEPTSLDLTVGYNYSEDFVAAQMCEPLLRQLPNFEVAPGLASWKQPEPKKIVYQIKKGITFWDGSELTAEDVVYSLKRNSNPNASFGVFYANVASIEATGPLQVTVRFSKPDELFNKELAGPAGTIVQKAFTEKAGPDFGTAAGGLMCTGPFELESWKPGSSIVLKRNDSYWDKAASAHAKTVEFKFLSDATALAQALKAEEVDGAYEIPPTVIPALQKSDSGKVYFGPSTQMLLFSPMHGGPDLPAKLRRALFGVVDREGLARVIFAGAAQPNYTLVPANMWPPESRGIWAKAYKPFEEHGQLSEEEAKKLVEESGYDGKQLSLAVLSGNSTQSQVAQLIQQEASKIGVKIEIVSLQDTQYSELVSSRQEKYDFTVTTGFNYTADPIEPLEYWLEPESIYDYTGYSNPTVSRLMQEARESIDPRKAAELLVKGQKIWEAASTQTSLLGQDEILYLSDKLTGATVSVAYITNPSLASIGPAE